MDRTIAATLSDAIKLDMKITDAALGLLRGFAFSIPRESADRRLSERHGRHSGTYSCARPRAKAMNQSIDVGFAIDARLTARSLGWFSRILPTGPSRFLPDTV